MPPRENSQNANEGVWTLPALITNEAPPHLPAEVVSEES